MNKGLEALQKIENELAKAWGMDIAYDEKVFDSFHIVGKELQALEIIENKKVNVEIFLKHSKDKNYKEFIEYEKKFIIFNSSVISLTQEEYDLLKEKLL